MNSTPFTPLIPIAALVATVALIVWRRKVVRSNYKVPEPAQKRKGILYGYYATLGNQVAETKDHVNLHWATSLEGEELLLKNMAEANLPTVLDLAHYLFDYHNRHTNTYKEDAPDRLRYFFNRLRERNLLHLVHYLTPIDEPNMTTTQIDLNRAMVTLKQIVSEYPELSQVKYSVILSGAREWCNVDEFDIVGMDDYMKRSGIFYPKLGKYHSLKKILKPHQKTIIMPGGSYGQDPTPFINFAHSNPEVAMVVPFLWSSAEDMGEKIPGIGTRSDVKSLYVQAGKELTQS